MKRSFWKINKDIHKNCLILDPINQKELNYGEVDEYVLKLSEMLNNGEKRLAFLFCENDYKSIIFYLALLNSGNAVLLLDNKLNDEIKKELIFKYQPELIFHPGKLDSKDYHHINLFDEYSYYLVKTNYKLPVHKDIAVLLSTSGTTGSPKLVKLTYDNIQANAESISEYLKLNESERAITSLPMNYSFGLSVINTHLLNGASLLLTEKSIIFKDFWNEFNEYNCTSFAGVPYSYTLLKRTHFEKMSLPTLRYMTQAGGRLSTDLIKYYHDLSKEKNFKFYVMYGQTEATARISYVPYEKLKDKIGSIGISIPGGEISLSIDGRQITEPYVTGELVYKGGNVMMGYAEKREDLIKDDELNHELKTGDIGYKDSEGYFYITGRIKRFIKIFGMRLNLDEVERMIENQFNIYNACTGNDEKLLVLIQSDLASTENYVHLKIAEYYKLHKSAIMVKHIEKIPATESGKKDYQAISKLFLD